MIFDLTIEIFSILLSSIRNPIIAGPEKINPKSKSFKIKGSKILLNLKKQNLINNPSTGTKLVKSQTLMGYFIIKFEYIQYLIDEELSI
ncbi:hypothetical protein CHA01nite_14510 [Chryseobacterium hagamense]|uniref:Uncharacterized protein n=1 Tax=Chryseobacterium hagamense TaxID=395935 RepID=A0A511YKH4_9FLAO|nr:hypothetical protein CHA01nite_14510 [Chryseobacterium hagamense]